MLTELLIFCSFIHVTMLGQSGCPVGTFGSKCEHTCHCLDDVSCDVMTGTCSDGCAKSWSGPNCQRENIAYGRPVSQKDGRNSNNGSYAVDNDMFTCSATKSGVPGWWTLKLDRGYKISSVSLMTNISINLKSWKIYIGEEENIFLMTLCTTIRVYGDEASVDCDLPVTGHYVTVINREGPVVICHLMITACSHGWYGDDCDKECHCADGEEVCDATTGACASGCSPGWIGRDCNRACHRWYGEDCRFRCGHCVNGTMCDHETGVCHQGCEQGWSGPLCDQGCRNRTYGNSCQLKCGHCNRNDTCDHVTGQCPHGCASGWKGIRCQSECEDGKYGNNCAFDCGKCKTGTNCDKKFGFCEEGCSPGWEGLFCTQKCLPGYYGSNCAEKCQDCFGGLCNAETGKCLEGCPAGKIGPDCSQSCPIGHYGVNCNHACGHCKDDEPCDFRTGICPGGCKPGYNGSLCLQGCPKGFYGMNCSGKCGACTPGTTCNLETGVCEDGCSQGFSGDLCITGGVFSDESGPQLQVFLGTTFTIVTVIMTAVILCLVITWRREHLTEIEKKKSKSEETINLREIVSENRNGEAKFLKDAEDIDHV